MKRSILLSFVMTLAMLSCTQSENLDELGGEGPNKVSKDPISTTISISVAGADVSARHLGDGNGLNRPGHWLIHNVFTVYDRDKAPITDINLNNVNLGFGGKLTLPWNAYFIRHSWNLDEGGDPESDYHSITNQTNGLLINNFVNTRQGPRDGAMYWLRSDFVEIVKDGRTNITSVPQELRIEMTGRATNVSGYDNAKYKSMEIEAVYINRLRNNRNSDELHISTPSSWKNDYVDSDNYYVNPKTDLFDVPRTEGDVLVSESWSITNSRGELITNKGVLGTKTGSIDNVVGYNLYPQGFPKDAKDADITRENAIKYHPHIIFKVRVLNVAPRYLTINHFMNIDGTIIRKFDTNYIYKINMNDIVQILLNDYMGSTTPDPDPNGDTLEGIQVDIEQWVKKDINIGVEEI